MSFNELQALELPRYFTNLAAFHAEMDRRFDQIECMLAGQVPESQPAVIELDVDVRALESLSHFQKAALGFTRSRAQRLASLTLSLFNCVSDIKGLQTNPSPPQTAPLSTSKTSTPAQGHDAGFTWDPDRMLSSVHVMLFVLMAWLLIIYVEGIPGGATLLALGVPIGMALATMPHIPITRMFLPATGSVLFGGLVYIFVLPKLSSFIGLGALLFTVTFAICYLFAAPQQALGRALGLAMFIAITAIDNQQSYSFLHVADTAMVFPLFFALLMMAAYIPYPPLPERVFLRLLTRYFRSAGYLVSTLGKDPQQPLTRREAWRKRYHAQQIATLPGKLGIWGKIIDPRLFPATDPKQVQALVVNMHALSFRISALIEARQHAQAELLARELTQDVRRWREAIQVLFRNWSQQPEKTPAQPLEQRLQTLLATLEARISESFEKIGKEKLMREDYQNFYRLLGAFRGLSEALVSYADLSGRMSLAQWRESRF